MDALGSTARTGLFIIICLIKWPDFNSSYISDKLHLEFKTLESKSAWSMSMVSSAPPWTSVSTSNISSNIVSSIFIWINSNGQQVSLLKWVIDAVVNETFVMITPNTLLDEVRDDSIWTVAEIRSSSLSEKFFCCEMEEDRYLHWPMTSTHCPLFEFRIFPQKSFPLSLEDPLCTTSNPKFESGSMAIRSNKWPRREATADIQNFLIPKSWKNCSHCTSEVFRCSWARLFSNPIMNAKEDFYFIHPTMNDEIDL